MAKSFVTLLTLRDWFCFSASGTRKLMSLSIHPLMPYKYQHSQHFCWVYFEELGYSYSHHQRTDQFQIWKHWLRNQSDILYHFLHVTYPRDCLLERTFPTYSPIWKRTSISFNLVSKFASCPVAPTDITGVGFILTVPDGEEVAVVVIVEGEVRVTRLLLLAVVIGTVA